MSSDLYEVLSLAARYLFTLLGVLIALRAFVWLLSDRAEKRRRIRQLPDAGRVGELVVLSGGPDLPEGTVLPLSWEGVLGSVRTCDVCVPCGGVRRQHLFFSFHAGVGLCIHPLSGCEARVNDVPLTCHSREDAAPMVQGSFLAVGSALLRLRLFAGLDPRAGVESEVAPPSPEGFPEASPAGIVPQSMPDMPADPRFSAAGTGGAPFPAWQASSPYPPFIQEPPLIPEPPVSAGGAPLSAETIPDPPLSAVPLDNASASPEGEIAPRPAAPRRRRADRWEADWSD